MSVGVLAISNTLIKELFRRKDVFIMLFLALVILAGAASLSFFQISDVENYLKEISMSITLLFTAFITIGLTARQLPMELEKKTLYPILTRPCSRWQFLIGKYTGVVLASSISLLTFHVCCLAIFVLKGIAPGWQYLEAVVLQMCCVCLLAAMILFFSTVMSSASTVFGIGLLAYLFLKWFGSNIEILVKSKSNIAGTIVAFFYTIMPHFEFFDLSQRVVFSRTYAAVGIMDMLFFMGYAAGYSGLFLWLAWLAFRKKNL